MTEDKTPCTCTCQKCGSKCSCKGVHSFHLCGSCSHQWHD